MRWFYQRPGDAAATLTIVYAQAALLRAVSRAQAERRGMWGACRVSWVEDGQVDTRSR